MANEINVALGQSGLTVTGTLYLDGVSTGTTISLTEVSGSGGFYTGTMPGFAANVYEILFYVNAVFRCAGMIDWTGSAEAIISSRLATSAYTAPDNTGIATLLTRLSSARALLLDNLDAAVTSRSTLDASGVWSYVARTLTAFGFSVAVGDKTGFSLTSGEHTLIQSDADAALQAKGLYQCTLDKTG
jgi:hypothetical protein